MGDYLQYVCSLPNPDTVGRVYELFTDKPEEIDAFVKKHDGFGRGIYDCIGLFAPGTKRRRKDTVVALPILVVDLDLKNMVDDRQTVLQSLRDLVIPPTEVRDSGYGLHAIWKLKEPLVGEDIQHGEMFMRTMVGLLSGDPKPTHRAALLRRPGTHNTKGGHSRRCHVIEGFHA